MQLKFLNSKPGKCFICDESGHWKRDCPTKKRREMVNEKGSAWTGKKGEALIAMARPRSQRKVHCKKDNGSSKTSGKCEAFITLVEAVTASSVVARCTDWFLDSGASDHMTFRRDWFVEFEEIVPLMKVRIGNGSHIFARGQGSINVLAFNGMEWVEKHLSNVLYVPDIHLNLFSQNTALDKGLQLIANSEKCEFKKGNETVAIAVRKENLFRLMFKVVMDIKSYAATKEIVNKHQKETDSSGIPSKKK